MTENSMTENERRFAEIKPRRMRHDVLRQLRNAILDGTFKPGERLNESEIARQMGISRGPVREAILALEEEGLITTIHWRGSYVAEVDPESFRELIELRILLETHAAKRAAQNFSPADGAELERLVEEMRAANAAGDLDDVIDHDLDFHHTICRMGGNSLLLKAWEQLSGRLRLAILLSLQLGYDAGGMIETHPPVIEALQRGEADLAAQLLNDRTWEAANIIMALVKGDRPQSLLAAEAD